MYQIPSSTTPVGAEGMFSEQYDNLFAREGMNLSGEGFVKEDLIDEMIRKKADLMPLKIFKKTEKKIEESWSHLLSICRMIIWIQYLVFTDTPGVTKRF